MTMSRSEARARGLREYFTGKPCHAGHIAARLVSNCTCRICLSESIARARSNSVLVARTRERKRLYAAAHRDQTRALLKKWKETNPEAHHRHLEKGRALWSARNPDKLTARLARRRAQRLNRVPKWANHFFIGEAYALAKLRDRVVGMKWEVDHIIPLRHKLVSGMHVEHNLQVITAQQNKRKSQLFPVRALNPLEPTCVLTTSEHFRRLREESRWVDE